MKDGLSTLSSGAHLGRQQRTGLLKGLADLRDGNGIDGHHVGPGECGTGGGDC
jgi:hypothetical protein